MSCDNLNVPINIIKDNKVASCNGKCNLRYNYTKSNISSINKNNYLEINLTNKTNTVINYSTNTRGTKCQSQGGEFVVDHMRIYHPSIHTYNDRRSNAELIIVHKNTSGADDLLICLPISISSGTQPEASSQLSYIINVMKDIGNSSGEGGQIPNLNLNLNSFIPNKPFYTYSGMLPFIPCSDCAIFIVYDVNQASININPETFGILKKIIESKLFTIQKVTTDLGLAYNSEGAQLNTGSLGNDIWIDCKPTGSNGQVLIDETPVDLQTTNISIIDRIKEIFFNPYTFIIIGIIMVLVIFYIIRKVINKITSYQVNT